MEELGRIWKNWVKFGEIRKTLEKLGRIGKSWEELGKIGKNIFDDEQTRIYRQKITCMYSVYQPQKCKKKLISACTQKPQPFLEIVFRKIVTHITYV